MNWRRGDIALALFATARSAREAAKLSSQQMQPAPFSNSIKVGAVEPWRLS